MGLCESLSTYGDLKLQCDWLFKFRNLKVQSDMCGLHKVIE